MGKSIESVWQKAFLDHDNLVAPKVVDIYNRKSVHIIDKFAVAFKWNLVLLAFFGIGSCLYFFLMGVPVIAMITFFLWIGYAIYSYRKSRELQEIDKASDCYQYLLQFKQWIDGKTALYIKVYRFFLPAIIFSSYLGLLYIPAVNEALKEISTTGDVLGVPIDFSLVVLAISLFFSAMARHIYRWDIGIMYGRLMKRLDQLLQDMQELRAEI